MIRLPRYTLTDLLHESTAAAVYRGVSDDGAPVAVKLLAGVTAPAALDRLRSEFAILKAIDAPSIIRPIALEKHDGGLALVLEGFAGIPLDAVVRSRRLDLLAAVEIGAELSRALAAVHQAGFVNRDIKPANVLYDPQTRRIKLIDFGIAMRLEATVAAPNDDGVLEGTLAYLAPEQTGRLDLLPDARSDLYSLGITLYELIAGAPPFRFGDPADLVHAHLTKMPPPLSAALPDVPAVVSDIVMKLVHKAREDRYQSASGLLFDLERCVAELRETGTVAPFLLGSRDSNAQLAVPERLYGRDAEQAALCEALERAAGGGRELVLVEGPSGVGKSALVRALAPAAVARQGHFVAGKCDQKARNAPYAPVIGALRELFGRIATGSDAERLRLGDELSAALGPNGPILACLVPEAQRVIGSQQRPPEVGTAEAQNRLAIVLGATLRVLSGPGRPLVVFLDDLQWADPATAWLVRVLFTDEKASGLLVIGALRDDPLPADHPLPRALSAIRDRGAAVLTLQLGPLGLNDLQGFVADTLGAHADQVAGIAEVLHARTGGNPFFSFRLLCAMHEGGAVVRDVERGVMAIDRTRLQAAWHNGDVAELVAGELAKLPSDTQGVLALAAAVGHSFDGETLALVAAKPEAEIEAALAASIRQGHIELVARDDAHATEAGSSRATTRYRFAHDRLQHAASQLSGEPQRCQHALDVGRILLARAEQTGRDDDLFDAADHLNEGATLLAGEAARAALAKTNLRAGQRAKAQAAFDTASRYFQAGVLLAGAHRFDHDRDLAFALHLELAECEAAKGDEDAALARLLLLDGQAQTALEQVHVATIRVGLFSLLSKFPDALHAGLVALEASGIALPAGEEARKAALQSVLLRAADDLRAHPPASRLSAGEMTDPEALALERLLVAMTVPAYFVDPALLGIVILAWVDLVNARGHSKLSAMGYATYGFFLSFYPERQRDAYEIGKLALAFNEKMQNRALLCKVTETFAGNIAFLHEPMRDVLARFPAAWHAGIQSGDFVHAAYICDHTVVMRLGIGDALEAIGTQADEFLPLIERTNDVFSATIMKIVKQAVKNLAGKTSGRTSLSDQDVDEQAIATLVAGEGFGNLAAIYRTVRLMVLVVHGLWEDALVEAHAAEEKSEYAAGQFFFTDLTFFAALARIRGGGETAQGSPALARHIAHMKAWAALCPANFEQKLAMVQAELARQQGDELWAMRLYDQAIHAARENELLRDEAIACELSAEFHRERGRARIARAYATDAYQAYLAWGAEAKVEDMQRGEKGFLLRPSAAGPPWLAPAVAAPITLTNTAGREISARLDMAAVINAAQTIASEIVLPKVIEKLLKILTSSAGAERGHLLLDQNGTWLIVARLEPDGVETGLHIPLDEACNLAASVVRHVTRSRDPVLLADAARDSHFALDPYVARHRPKSIFCMEMAQKGRRAGVVYLENNALRGAFGKDRIEPLRILLSQAAIAIEISSLYERVEAASDELRQANARLEDEVARRTEQLQYELIQRAAAEQERQMLSEEVIRVQEERIIELSAPLLPISDKVLVMPLIGGMDAGRATRVLEAALEGAGGWHAKSVIIDITGVKNAGAEIAEGLIRTARALRMLGAEAVITGVRAEVARAFIALGTDLGGIVTKSTLKAGIVHAMARQS